MMTLALTNTAGNVRFICFGGSWVNTITVVLEDGEFDTTQSYNGPPERCIEWIAKLSPINQLLAFDEQVQYSVTYEWLNAIFQTMTQSSSTPDNE